MEVLGGYFVKAASGRINKKIKVRAPRAPCSSSELSLEIPIIQNALFMCTEQRSNGTELRQSPR